MSEEELKDQVDAGDSSAEEGDVASAQEAENRRARRAAAARARKNRLRERKEAEAIGLDAQEMLDDALVRTQDSAAKWFRRNWQIIQWVIVGGLAIWGAWGLYDLRQASAKAEASDELAEALAAERGIVGEEPDEQQSQVDDPTPRYKTDDERVADAIKKAEEATQLREGSGTQLFAELTLASLRLDAGKADEAKTLFESVKASKLAQAYPELRGRAMEGVALALDAKGDQAGALKAYAALENAELDGFTELALVQQVRLHLALNHSEEAKAALEKLSKKVGPLSADPFPSYTQQALKGFAEELDPELLQKPKMDLEQLKQEMQRIVTEKAKGGSSPPVPDPAPAALPTTAPVPTAPVATAPVATAPVATAPVATAPAPAPPATTPGSP